MLVPWQHPDSTRYSSLDQLVYFIDKYADSDSQSALSLGGSTVQVIFPPNAPLGLRFSQVHPTPSSQLVLVKDVIPNAFNHLVPRHTQLTHVNGVDVAHLAVAGLDRVLHETQHLVRHCVFTYPAPCHAPPLHGADGSAPAPQPTHAASSWLHFIGPIDVAFAHRTLTSPRHIVDVACGPRHVILRSSSGRVFSFGSGDSGRLGHGDTLSRSDPTLIQALRSQVVVGVTCGRDHSAVVCASGLAYGFGWGEGGRLGIGDDAGDVVWPTQIVLPNAVEGYHLAAAGRECTVLVSRCDRVFLCGLAAVGPNSHALHLTPHHIQIDDIDSDDDACAIVNVKAGDAHCVVWTADGVLYSWGDGASGALGHGDLVTKLKPTRVRGLPAVHKVVCGAWHTACLTAQGHVWVWGDAGGMAGPSATPTLVKPHRKCSLVVDEHKTPECIDVACGADGSTYVLQQDLTVWSWHQSDPSGPSPSIVWPPEVAKKLSHGDAVIKTSPSRHHHDARSVRMDAGGAYLLLRQPSPRQSRTSSRR